MAILGFFSKLSKKERVGLIVAGIIVVAVLIDRLVVNPAGIKLKHVEQQITLSEKKLSLDLRNILNKDFIESEYKKHKNFVKKSSVSDEENISNMLAEIESLARTAGVTLVDIKPQVAKQIDFYKEYAVEVTIEGPIEQIVIFLHKLNNTAQLFRAVKLRLGMKQKELLAVRATMLVTHISM